MTLNTETEQPVVIETVLSNVEWIKNIGYDYFVDHPEGIQGVVQGLEMPPIELKSGLSLYLDRNSNEVRNSNDYQKFVPNSTKIIEKVKLVNLEFELEEIKTSIHTKPLTICFRIKPRLDEIYKELKRIKHLRDLISGPDHKKGKHLFYSLSSMKPGNSGVYFPIEMYESMKGRKFDKKDYEEVGTQYIYEQLIKHVDNYLCSLTKSYEWIEKRGFHYTDKGIFGNSMALPCMFVKKENVKINITTYIIAYYIKFKMRNAFKREKDKSFRRADTVIFALSHGKWNLFWEGTELFTKDVNETDNMNKELSILNSSVFTEQLTDEEKRVNAVKEKKNTKRKENKEKSDKYKAENNIPNRNNRKRNRRNNINRNRRNNRKRNRRNNRRKK
jgi:hypothetical protein